MVKSIPPGSNIPPNIRRQKRGELKSMKSDNKITRHMGLRLEAYNRNRPVIRRSSNTSEPYRIQGKPAAVKRLGNMTLEKLLAWGQQEEQKCLNLLKVLPPELPEYNEVLEKLGKLQDVLGQVKRQLATRK